MRPSTKDTYLKDVKRFVAFAGADPKNWTRERTQEFYTELLAAMKPQSANRVMASLRFVGNWYATQKADAGLDFSQIQLAHNKIQAREALEPEEAKALLGTCGVDPPGIRDFALMVVGLETGMRRMSLASMDWATTELTDAPRTSVVTKGRDELQVVPLSPTAVAALRPWRLWSAVRGHDHGPVFAAIRGSIVSRDNRFVVADEALSDQGIYAIVTQRAKAAGLRHVHPHLFRHSCITWRAEAGVPSQVIAALSGHRLPKDGLGTMFRYIDKGSAPIIEQARASTPAWLAEFVTNHLSRSSR